MKVSLSSFFTDLMVAEVISPSLSTSQILASSATVQEALPSFTVYSPEILSVLTPATHLASSYLVTPVITPSLLVV